MLCVGGTAGGGAGWYATGVTVAGGVPAEEIGLRGVGAVAVVGREARLGLLGRLGPAAGADVAFGCRVDTGLVGLGASAVGHWQAVVWITGPVVEAETGMRVALRPVSEVLSADSEATFWMLEPVIGPVSGRVTNRGCWSVTGRARESAVTAGDSVTAGSRCGPGPFMITGPGAEAGVVVAVVGRSAATEVAGPPAARCWPAGLVGGLAMAVGGWRTTPYGLAGIGFAAVEADGGVGRGPLTMIGPDGGTVRSTP